MTEHNDPAHRDYSTELASDLGLTVSPCVVCGDPRADLKFPRCAACRALLRFPKEEAA